MNPISDFRNSTRISLLGITIACVASMAFAAGATRSEPGILQVSPNGDIRETIVRAFRGPQPLKSFRTRQVWSRDERHATIVTEVVRPDRTHTIQNDKHETIFIGSKGYIREGSGPWTMYTDRIPTDTSGSNPHINEQIKTIGQVKFIGADNLDGVSVSAYEYEYIDASGKRTSGPHKIWIGLKDGLAYRTEMETQCPANDWGKPGDSGLVTIKVVTNYDWNPEIIIDLPEKAAREAAESWLKLIDSGSYSASWAEAAVVLKERYSENAWEKRLNGFTEQTSELGPIKSRELMSVESVKSLPSSREREGVLLNYRGQLVDRGPREKMGARSQTLELVLDTDQVWRVANYTEVVPGQAANGQRPVYGEGRGGGMGPGDGRGAGPGRGYNTGEGAGVPATSVDSKPVPLNLPMPQYTEEARHNKITGEVVVRVLVGADGSVKGVKVTRGLPYGLNEKAIEAAYQLRFKPAMKAGQPVAWWVTFSVDFNLR